MSWRPFLDEVRSSVRPADLLLLASVPIVLVAVHLLPSGTRAGLMLEYGDPTLANLWTAAYVHHGNEHLANNAGAYVAMVVPAYLLFAFAGERHVFRATFASFLLVLPAVIGAVNAILIGGGTGAGFSGVAAAFLGLLPVAVLVFLRSRFTDRFEVVHGVVGFLAVSAAIVAIYGRWLAAAGILAIAALIGVHDARRIGRDELRRTARMLGEMPGHRELVVFAVFAFLLSPLALFPQEVARDGEIVNVVAHYVGFLAGFFGPTVWLTIRRFGAGEDGLG